MARQRTSPGLLLTQLALLLFWLAACTDRTPPALPPLSPMGPAPVEGVTGTAGSAAPITRRPSTQSATGPETQTITVAQPISAAATISGTATAENAAPLQATPAGGAPLTATAPITPSIPVTVTAAQATLPTPSVTTMPSVTHSGPPITITHGVADVDGRIVRATLLLGVAINNAQHINVGKLSDLIVHLPDGQVEFAIVAYGGVLGLGAKFFPLPLNALRYDHTNDVLALNMDETTLQNHPGYAVTWPDLTTLGYMTEVKTFWQALSLPIPADFLPRGSGSTGGAAKVTELLGHNVRNSANMEVGEIQDLLVNLQTGQVEYAVLSFGGFLGIGDQLIAVPMDAFAYKANPATDSPSPAPGTLTLNNIDEQTLQKAPSFGPDAYPDTSQPKWDEAIRRFWMQR